MKIHFSKIAFACVVTAAFLLPLSASAQLLDVKQTVFGMDCAPCAYSLERGMKALEGVEAVTVSLNESLVTLQFQPKNEITLQEIRQSIQDHGFSAEQATIHIAGRLERQNGQWILTSTSGARYLLEQVAEKVSKADLKPRALVIVTGTVPEGEKPSEGWQLEVSTLDHT